MAQQSDTLDRVSNFPEMEQDTQNVSKTVYRYYAPNPSDRAEVTYTKLDPNRYQHHPAWWGPDYNWHLGNMGSPMYPVEFQPVQNIGFRVDRDAFLPYAVRTENIPFYDLDIAYTDLHYTQGGSQNDGFLQADFGRDFGGGTQLSIKYRRLFQLAEIQNIGQFGQFEPQNTRLSSIGAGFQYRSPSGKYRNFIIYSLNSFKHRDTGGLEDDSELVDGMASSEFTLDVVLEDAITEHIYQDIAFIQHLQPSRGDSSQQKQWQIKHSLIYRDRLYKFSDTDVEDSRDISFYNGFINDDRGIRQFVQHKSLENHIEISTSLKNEAFRGTVFSTQRLHWLDQEVSDSTLFELPVGGRLHWRIRPGLEFTGSGKLMLGTNAGNYELRSDLTWSNKKLGTLNGGLILRQYPPSLSEEELFVTRRPLWNFTFSPTTVLSLHGQWDVEKWGLNVRGRISNLDNFIYFNTEGFPEQEEGSVSVWSLRIAKKLSWRSLHFDNAILIQESSTANIPVPGLYTWHSLYMEDALFKDALGFRVGFEMRWFESFFGKKYQPVLNAYHIQDQRMIGGTPILDFFFVMQVQSFTAYFRMNHMLPFFNDDVVYLSPLHPLYDRYFRLGIAWTLRG